MAKSNVELKFSLKDGVSSGLGKISKGIGDVDAKLGKVAITAGLATAALALVGAGAGIAAGISAAADLESAIARAGQATGATTEQLEGLANGTMVVVWAPTDKAQRDAENRTA